MMASFMTHRQLKSREWRLQSLISFWESRKWFQHNPASLSLIHPAPLSPHITLCLSSRGFSGHYYCLASPLPRANPSSLLPPHSLLHLPPSLPSNPTLHLTLPPPTIHPPSVEGSSRTHRKALTYLQRFHQHAIPCTVWVPLMTTLSWNVPCYLFIYLFIYL